MAGERPKAKGVIPIADARALGVKRKCPLVVIFAIEDNRERFTVTTWGKTREFCQLAAGFGDDIADAVYGGKVEPRATPDGLPPEPTVKTYTTESPITKRGDMADYDPHGVWKMWCRMCEHEWVAVAPVGVDEETMECPNCGHMTGEPRENAGGE